MATVRSYSEMDPREVLDWGIDWSSMVSPGETITAQTWSTPDAYLGVVVTDLGLVGMTSYARVAILAGLQDDAAWDEPGTKVTVSCEIVTSAAREILRTLRLRMFRGAVSPKERVLEAL